jgi:hypothetical protein
VAVAGNYAYVADLTAGLRVISIADPAHPTEAGYDDTPGYTHSVAVSGGYAYLADGVGGLQIYQFYGGGVEETPSVDVRTANGGATIVRGVLYLGDCPRTGTVPCQASEPEPRASSRRTPACRSATTGSVQSGSRQVETRIPPDGC